MDQRRPPPVGGDAAVMAEYFETMRQFLETQERVMTAFMGGDVPAMPRALPRQRPAALPRYGESAPRVNGATPLAEPAALPAMPVPSAPPRPSAAAVAMNGHGGNPANGSGAPHATNGATDPVAMAASAAPAPQPTNGAGGDKESGGEISREKLTELLLAIVEEKTGYPRDMVGLQQSLESDLGIDSIKRIEVVGAMLQALPARYREALTPNRSKLNTQTTLEGMLSLLRAAGTGGAASVPFDVAGTETEAAQSLPSRHVVESVAEPIDPSAQRRITTGPFLVTEDGLGLSSRVATLLAERGCRATVVPADVLADETRLREWVARERAALGSVAGVVHLAPAGAPWLDPHAALAAWRDQLVRNEKSLFILLREVAGSLAADAHVLSLSALGGLFGREPGAARGLSVQGGAPGLLKSLREERPTLRVRAVDVDAARPLPELAATVLQELELAGGRLEVGYPGGLRTVFRTVAAASSTPAPSQPLGPLVVLATGGARGVTAECLRELAQPGNTLVLVGRSTLDVEPAAVAACAGADELRQLFIAEARGSASKPKPVEIQRRVAAVLAGREMRANIEDFRRLGAVVDYRAADVLDEGALAALIADVEARHGPIGGVVHGAGVIEDKLLADKTDASWSRVVETKVLGLALLQRHLRPASLRFLSVFSSVAGRYGNSGQSDYASANELMNRLCCQLRDQWQGQVEVHALCWGPWDATRFGSGMVTAETEAKFAAKGVILVDAATGRRLFREAVSRPPGGAVEIVCGQGPWEAREAAAGASELAPPLPLADLLGPMLGPAVLTKSLTGEQVFAVSLDARHRYLSQHRIDGVAVLPAAGAVELVGDAIRSLWPGWKVVETRDFRLIKGVELKDGPRTLQVAIQPPTYGSSEGFEVGAAVRSDLGSGRSLVHYRGVVRLEQRVQGELARTPLAHTSRKVSVAAAYDQMLFHGPCFQVIEAIDGFSEKGSLSRVRGSRPADWLAGIPEAHNRWTFDPALVDAAAQMAILWARTLRGETCLPVRFGRIVRLREALPPGLTMELETLPASDASTVRANVYFIDAAGQVVLLIEEMECIASAALNRLGGSVEKRAVQLSA